MAFPEWMRDCVNVVDDKLMRSIVEDFRRGPPPPGPTLPTATPVGAGKVVDADPGPKYRPYNEQGQGGWTKPPQVDQWKPPGLSIMDAMMDQQDAVDRAARARELAEAARYLRELAEAEAKLDPKGTQK
jgi:hypothetical protein